jgi:hypothetical protein
MEPRHVEKPVESRSEGATAPTRPTERKRRFQIIKLEERIAPIQGGKGTKNCFGTSGVVICACHSEVCTSG